MKLWPFRKREQTVGDLVAKPGAMAAYLKNATRHMDQYLKLKMGRDPLVVMALRNVAYNRSGKSYSWRPPSGGRLVEVPYEADPCEGVFLLAYEQPVEDLMWGLNYMLDRLLPSFSERCWKGEYGLLQLLSARSYAGAKCERPHWKVAKRTVKRRSNVVETAEQIQDKAPAGLKPDLLLVPADFLSESFVSIQHRNAKGEIVLRIWAHENIPPGEAILLATSAMRLQMMTASLVEVDFGILYVGGASKLDRLNDPSAPKPVPVGIKLTGGMYYAFVFDTPSAIHHIRFPVETKP